MEDVQKPEEDGANVPVAPDAPEAAEVEGAGVSHGDANEPDAANGSSDNGLADAEPSDENGHASHEAEGGEEDAAPAPSPRLERVQPPRRRFRFDKPMLAAIVGLVLIAAYFIFVAPFRSKAPVPSASLATGSASPSASPSAAAPEATVSSPTSQRPNTPHEPQWRIAKLAQDKSIEIVEAAVGKRPLVTALAASGVNRNEAQRIFNSFRNVRNFNRALPKHTFIVARKKGKTHVLAFEYVESPSQIWQARESELGVLEGKKLELAVEEKHVTAGFPVEGDLRESVKKAGFDPSLLESLDDALDGHAELAEVRPGARLRVIATEERIDGAFTRYTDINAVEYFPAPSGKAGAEPAAPIRVYHYVNDRRARGYYDAAGKRPYRGGWRAPLPGSRISSRFNPKRKHPTLHIVIPHNGVDFAAPSGTPVYASADGVVKHAGDGGPCGNMVQIEHKNGLISSYCHLSRFAAGLHAGENVDARQLVGYVGQTGRATGPHLHFAVKRRGAFIDPLSLKLDGVRVLPSFARAEFDEERKRLDTELDGIGLPAGAEPPPAAADAGAPKPDETEEILDDMEAH
ncbi:peptidoglycan DD-metalloendopeptidase family protein [Pendulispora rubella]|uniref:Peptidoglycan DD-metalloendopeptidase family protein n=1 Tax=Pendulispora rubella TaxID=2741070 RepID=A0ABZ2LDZ3_9BACT